MALDVTTFRRMAGNEGFLKASGGGDDAKVVKFGDGFMGKLSSWIRDPGAVANKQLKATFVHSLNQKYGADFTKSVLDRIDSSSSKPLSARTVRDIIADGDALSARTPGMHKQTIDVGGTDVAHSSFSGAAQLSEAAGDFIKSMGFSSVEKASGRTEVGSSVLKGISAHVDRPQQDSKFIVGQNLLGATSVVNFANTFGDGGKFVELGGEYITKYLTENNINAKLFNDVAVAPAQIVTRLSMSADAMAQYAAKNDEKGVAGIAKEALGVTKGQIDRHELALSILSKAEFIDGAPKEMKGDLLDFRAQVLKELEVLRDTRGPFQGLIALAATAASDPNKVIEQFRGTIVHKDPPAVPA